MLGANPVRVRHRDRHDRGGERPRRLEAGALPGSDYRAGALGTQVGASFGRGRHIPELRVECSIVGLGEDGRARIGRGSLGDRGRAVDHGADALFVEPVRARHTDPIVVDDADLQLGVVLAHVLVDLVRREARERRVLAQVERLGLLRRRVPQRAVEQRSDVVARRYHRPTPTLTLRKRAGAAP